MPFVSTSKDKPDLSKGYFGQPELDFIFNNNI